MKNDKQVDVEHYGFLKYEHANRFASYFFQIKTILEHKINDILEIGRGSGLFYREIRNLGLNIRTVDLDADLTPDIIADLRKLPIENSSVECICAFQVLEHLPFDDFDIALSELKRVSKNYIFISLPDASKYIKLDMRLPRVGKVKKFFSLRKLGQRIHKFDGEHYWEVNKKGYDEQKLRELLPCTDWSLEMELRLLENPFHRFYLLKKRNG